MICEKYKNRECVGKNWCGICPLYSYESDPDFCHKPTDLERYAMKCQQEFFKKYNEYLKVGKDDKAMSYYSCIQIMERVMREV